MNVPVQASIHGLQSRCLFLPLWDQFVTLWVDIANLRKYKQNKTDN